MNTAKNLPYQDSSYKITNIKEGFRLKYCAVNEKKILKVFLLGYLHKLFCEIFQQKIQFSKINSSLECYAMDCKIIQLLIQGIIETGEYTLEGIAYHTQIPLDIIYDAASGINNRFSITPWAKVVDLYIQVNPDIAQVILNKLLEIKNKNNAAFSSLLTEA